jgi:hypothetical protein
LTYRGKVKNGVIVLENSTVLPEGTIVTVRPLKGKRTPAKPTKRRTKVSGELAKLAGQAKDLPADAARNLDHYLYGRAKQ